MSEDKNGNDMLHYETAARVLLSSEGARGKIQDLILYKGAGGKPALAVVHTKLMHDNFFLEGDDTTYDCKGFVNAIIEGEAAELLEHVDIGCTVSEMVEEIPFERNTARDTQSEAMFRTFLTGKLFDPATGRFEAKAVTKYREMATTMVEAFRSGWNFYE